MITLAVQGHVPASTLRATRRWLYAGDDPSFELPDLERVSIADAKMAAADALRDGYLDAIGRLSLLNDSPEWWASNLAAKQPYPSLFSRVCGVAAARELAADGTLVVCSTLGQLEELRRWVGPSRVVGVGAARAGERIRETTRVAAWPLAQALGKTAPERALRRLASAGGVARVALEVSPDYRRRTLSALGAERLHDFEGEGTALLVTWIDRRSFTASGEFSDPHLGPLATMLRERGLRVATLAKALPHEPFADSAAAMLRTRQQVAFPDFYLSAADLRMCRRRISSWRPRLPADVRVGDVPFARLAGEYLAEQRRAHVQALMHVALMENLAAARVRPELIVFPWEGHAWELALILAAKRSMPDTQIVGYDNLNFSRLALSLYPSALEVDLRPLPDRVVTNGETFASTLKSSAFPDDRIRVGCALRHPDLLPDEHAASEGRSSILAACSIDAGQSIELVRKAVRAFGDQLVVRLHPASDARAIRAAVPAARYADEPLGALLPRAQVMLYTYSVVPYEALAAGVPPVFVRSEAMLDADQLDATPEIRWVARTPDELRAVAGQIRALTDRDAWRSRAREVVRAALRPPDGGCVEAFLS